MRTDSEKSQALKIGIECESIEGESWGVGRFLYKTLEQLATRPELAATHRFHLYFKKQIPDYPFLDSPLFVKTVTTPSWAPASFNFHYHVWMIARAYWDRVDMLFFPNYMLPLLWFKKSAVMLTEDIWYEMRNPQLPFRYRLAYAIFTNWAAKTATRIMAISHSSKLELTRLFGIKPQRIVVNELAVDPPRAVEPMPGKYLLYVGQAFERRHLRETIKAFETIAQDDHELGMTAIGPDRYQPPIINQLVRNVNERLGRPAIRHIDHVSDQELAQWYAGAQAIAYISSMEAFGLPPLEALSYGVPPVVADAPINREVYAHDAIYVSDPENIEQITAALRTALTDQAVREKIRTAAPAMIARYTWPAHTDRFLHIIHEILHP